MLFPLQTTALDGKGRLLTALNPWDSWFNPVDPLDTATGKITPIPADALSGHHSQTRRADGHILTIQLALRATLWKFTPAER